MFYHSDKKSINTASITNSKFNSDMLDSYARITLTGNPAEIYHLYIEYICFKVYTNENSKFELEVNLNLTNAVNEYDVGKSNIEDNTFSKTYSCTAKEKGPVQFKIEVKRTIATATGCTLIIDVLNSYMFANRESTFKWCIYDFKIYGEQRCY